MLQQRIVTLLRTLLRASCGRCCTLRCYRPWRCCSTSSVTTGTAASTAGRDATASAPTMAWAASASATGTVVDAAFKGTAARTAARAATAQIAAASTTRCPSYGGLNRRQTITRAPPAARTLKVRVDLSFIYSSLFLLNFCIALCVRRGASDRKHNTHVTLAASLPADHMPGPPAEMLSASGLRPPNVRPPSPAHGCDPGYTHGYYGTGIHQGW